MMQLESSKPLRNEKGQLLPGAVIGPNGSKGNVSFTKAALQKMADEFLGESSLDELKTLYEDKIKLGKLSTAKALVLTRLVGATAEGDLGRKEFESILDRLHGKPVGDGINVAVQVNTNFNSTSDDEILNRFVESRK